MKSMHNRHIEISVEYYSKINYSEALKLAIKEISGDPIYLRIKQKSRKDLCHKESVTFLNKK